MRGWTFGPGWGMRGTACAVVAVGSGLLASAPCSAQFIGAEVGTSSSDYRELADSRNVGARLAIPLGPTLSLTAHARRIWDSQEWERSRCSGLVEPGRECPEELFQGDFSLTSLGVGLLVDLALTDRMDLFFGADWSRYSVDGRWTSTESDARVGVFPEEATTDWGYFAGLFFRFWDNAGVSLTARRESPEFSACGADAYFPFCEAQQISALDVGLQWKPRVPGGRGRR